MSTTRTGLYFAALQLAFTLTWTVYVIFLPRLAVEAGIPKTWVIWILLADQVVFVFADWWMGARSDHAIRTLGRVGLQVALVTLASALAFLLLPIVAPGGSPWLFLAVTLAWTVTSSALRAPPLMLIGRYAQVSRAPFLVSMWLLGTGVAAAFAPYLTVTLRDADPRLPFALASVVLAASAWGLVWAEKHLSSASGPAAPGPESRTVLGIPPFLVFVALAGIGFQVHFSLNSAPGYLRFASPADLEVLMPVFWIGFNLAMIPLGWLAVRSGNVRLMLLGGIAAALAAAGGLGASSLQAYVLLQALCGAAWGAVMVGAFGQASELGRVGREGFVSGGLFSMLAAAAVLRIGVVALQLNADPAFKGISGWLPVILWAAAAAAGAIAVAAQARARLPHQPERPA